MATHRSNRGVQLDLGKLMSQQDKQITVGNTKTNARGDQLGRGGRVVKSADSIARDHYNNNPPTVAKKTTIKVDDVDKNKKPIEDDWKEPQTTTAAEETTQDIQQEDEWVEDAEGNFVKKSELEEATDESVSKSKTSRKKSDN